MKDKDAPPPKFGNDGSGKFRKSIEKIEASIVTPIKIRAPRKRLKRSGLKS